MDYGVIKIRWCQKAVLGYTVPAQLVYILLNKTCSNLNFNYVITYYQEFIIL